MNVLVTGAAGYIGSLLSKKILNAGYNLVIFDRYQLNDSVYSEITRHPRCITYCGDLRNTQLLSEAIFGCDVIIHLAGISDGRMGKEDPVLTKEINIKATKQLVENAKNAGVKRFLFASTIGVYGNTYSEPLTEKLRLNPIDPYSESKAICEEILMKTTNADFVTCSLRIAMVYGLSILTRFDFLVNHLVKIAVEKGELSIIGGKQKRPQIHVQDVADFYLNLLSIDSSLISGKSFNAVYSNPSVNELIERIKNYLPKIKINLLPERRNEDSFEIDGTKIKNELGLYSKYEFAKGISELINYLSQCNKN